MWFAVLVGLYAGLVWAALTSTVAMAMMAGAVVFGPRAIRFSAATLGACMSVFAGSYWLEIAGVADPQVAMDFRRGAGWVMWPALAWLGWRWMREGHARSRLVERLGA